MNANDGTQERAAQTMPEAEYLYYEVRVGVGTLEEAQKLAVVLQAEAEARSGWQYTTAVNSECDPAGWCQGKVEWMERRCIESALAGEEDDDDGQG